MADIEVSVVMPCLNEASTVGICVQKALNTLKKLNISGEVIVADNGSTDGSIQIARESGAKVVHQEKKGYGNAYLKGFAEAKGKYIVMGDADDSYDFTDLERFIQPLKDGFDMVMGNRLGGNIKKGAMPFLHRYFGVPLLTWMLNILFGGRIGDAHCGMRSFTKDAYQRMHLETTGMEFASEMIIKARQAGLKIQEIPITLHPDGRPGKPHLKSFTDGWRHIRFMLNYKPRVLYSLSGWVLIAFGIGGILGNIISCFTGGYPAIASTLWGAGYITAALAGYVLLLLSIIASARNYTGHFPAVEKQIEKFYRNFRSGKNIFYGLCLIIAGIILTIGSKLSTPGFVLLGILLMGMGIITIFAALLLGQMNVFGKE